MTKQAFSPILGKTGNLFAYTLYDADFVAAAKEIGARFARTETGTAQWIVDAAKADKFDAFCEICEDALIRARRAAAAKTAERDAPRAAASTPRRDRNGEASGADRSEPFAGMRGFADGVASTTRRRNSFWG